MIQNTHKILVVDDEPGIRESCRKVLSYEGYMVETAADGIEGFEYFKDQRDYSAALIDLKMPRMGGIELIEKIRSIDDDILLLVITAYATIDTAVEATKRGAYDYISKPFMPEELLLPLKNGLEARALAIEAKQLRKEREERLLEVAYERSRSRTIIDCMSDGVVVVNLEGQVVLRNAAAARILPWKSLENFPCPLSSLDCRELQDLFMETAKPSSKPGIISSDIMLGKSSYMISASPVIDQNGSVLGSLAVLRDVTALKELEVAKSMFVSMVAHELKSPLAAIEGYLGLMQDPTTGSDPEQNRKMLARSMLRARTLRNLVDELLSLRSLETGNFIISRTALNLPEVLSEIVHICKGKSAEKKISLTNNLNNSKKPPDVLADRDAMRSIFNNLIENAIKYTPEGGHVHIELSFNEHYVIVAVRDNGIGIAPSEKDKIFDEFYRVRNSYTANVLGTGLGLSLVKKLLDLHNGMIRVDSTLGKGSVFTVSIPLVSDAGKEKKILN